MKSGVYKKSVSVCVRERNGMYTQRLIICNTWLGIFVALCLQFDYDQYKKTAKGKKEPNTMSFPKPYFISCFIAYFLGLVTTVVVMHNFQAAQVKH